MTTNILKRLTYSFLISASAALFIGFIAADRTEGNEASMGVVMVQLLALLICLLNFILSLTALLNLRKDIRDNYISSAFSFMFLPSMVLSGLIFLIFKDSNSRVEFWDTSTIVAPVVVHVLMLAFYFTKFRQNLNEMEG